MKKNVIEEFVILEQQILGYNLVDCRQTESCFHLDNFIEGCCLFNENATCHSSYEESSCTFYSGDYYDQQDCLLTESCIKSIKKRNFHTTDKDRFGIIESITNVKPMTLDKSIIQNSTPDNSLSGTRTVSSPEQITSVTLLSFIIFAIFVVISFGYFYVLYHPLNNE